MVKKFDKIAIGAILGVIAPVVTFFLILKYSYTFQYPDKSLHTHFMNVMAPRMMSLSAIPNLAIFMLFTYTNRLRSARGVLGATIILAIAIFIIKLT